MYIFYELDLCRVCLDLVLTRMRFSTGKIAGYQSILSILSG